MNIEEMNTTHAKKIVIFLDFGKEHGVRQVLLNEQQKRNILPLLTYKDTGKIVLGDKESIAFEFINNKE